MRGVAIFKLLCYFNFDTALSSSGKRRICLAPLTELWHFKTLRFVGLTGPVLVSPFCSTLAN
jgi:hypothetical protein